MGETSMVSGTPGCEDTFAFSAALRSSWLPVARSSEVAPGPIARTLCGVDLVLFRSADGTPTALPDRCPHRNAPLSGGEVSDGCVVCPYHGWTFDGDGQCVEVPSSGPGATVPPKAHLAGHHCVDRYGLVWVSIDEPTTEIPPAPYDDDPEFRRINTPVEVWETSATRMIDNFMDISHFPWVHTGTFGAAAERVVAPIEVGELPDGYVGYAYDVTADNTAGGASTSGEVTDTVHRFMSTGFVLPFTVRSTIRYDSGLEHIIYLLMAPIDDERSYFTFIVWRRDDFAAPADEIIAFDLAIGAEDRAMLERIPGPLPLGNTGVVSVQSDRPSVEWKRRFVEFLGSA
ncbi:MAG: aromatic ring-hydroxylating dioxygenase subunit alpha [Actinomycetota bacterium]